MALVLCPFSFAKATVEAAGSPVGDAVDNAVRSTRATEREKVLPHFYRERFAAVGDFFPTDDLVDNFLDTRGSSTISVAAMARIDRREAAKETGHVTEVARNGGGLD
jgi:hypothetical protein